MGKSGAERLGRRLSLALYAFCVFACQRPNEAQKGREHAPDKKIVVDGEDTERHQSAVIEVKLFELFLGQIGEDGNHAGEVAENCLQQKGDEVRVADCTGSPLLRDDLFEVQRPGVLALGHVLLLLARDQVDDLDQIGFLESPRDIRKEAHDLCHVLHLRRVDFHQLPGRAVRVGDRESGRTLFEECERRSDQIIPFANDGSG